MQTLEHCRLMHEQTQVGCVVNTRLTAVRHRATIDRCLITRRGVSGGSPARRGCHHQASVAASCLCDAAAPSTPESETKHRKAQAQGRNAMKIRTLLRCITGLCKPGLESGGRAGHTSFFSRSCASLVARMTWLPFPPVVFAMSSACSCRKAPSWMSETTCVLCRHQC